MRAGAGASTPARAGAPCKQQQQDRPHRAPRSPAPRRRRCALSRRQPMPRWCAAPAFEASQSQPCAGCRCRRRAKGDEGAAGMEHGRAGGPFGAVAGAASVQHLHSVAERPAGMHARRPRCRPAPPHVSAVCLASSLISRFPRQCALKMKASAGSALPTVLCGLGSAAAAVPAELACGCCCCCCCGQG